MWRMRTLALVAAAAAVVVAAVVGATAFVTSSAETAEAEAATAFVTSSAETAEAKAPPRRSAPPAACKAGSKRSMRTERRAFAAVARTGLRAYRSPRGKPIARFGKLNVNGVETVFGVLAKVVDARCDAWYRVQLPIRPNGSVGFVRASAVRLFPVKTRIEIDLSERTVTFFRDGRRVLRTRSAIGSQATPTPLGDYYVNQRLIPTNKNGPFGPAAIGISAFSPVLTDWAQGGPVAIHGTNQPSSIGRAVSNGCLRIPNAIVRRVFDSTPAGTPVTIRA